MSRLRRFHPRRDWYNLSSTCPGSACDAQRVRACGNSAGSPIRSREVARHDSAGCMGRPTSTQQPAGAPTLIHRFGRRNREIPPRLINSVRETGIRCVGLRSPARQPESTSAATNPAREHPKSSSSLLSHEANGPPGWGALEMTVELTACTGGARGLTFRSARAYRHGDPRLNYEQALELALMIAERSKKARRP